MSTDRPRYRTETDPFYQGETAPRAEAAPPGAIVSPDVHRDDRIPPGQARTKKWPVLQAGRVPVVPPEQWSLTLDGLVERPARLTWDDFQALPKVQILADFHCVTRWSRLGNLWEGVATTILAQIAGIAADARFAIVGGADDGWTTNLPLSDFFAQDALLADRHDGRPLTAEHGGPVRLIVPRLYAWKSAKWITSVTFVRQDAPGYWERRGYHDRGDPWDEERYR